MFSQRFLPRKHAESPWAIKKNLCVGNRFLKNAFMKMNWNSSSSWLGGGGDFKGYCNGNTLFFLLFLLVWFFFFFLYDSILNENEYHPTQQQKVIIIIFFLKLFNCFKYSAKCTEPYSSTFIWTQLVLVCYELFRKAFSSSMLQYMQDNKSNLIWVFFICLYLQM